MAEVGVTFLSAILGVVFNKMASPEVVGFMQRRKPTEALLEKLKIALLSMNVVLDDAEEKEVTNPNVKTWIDELKDVAYDAEDILDEIVTVALRCQLRAEFKPVTGKVRNFISGTFFNPFVHRVDVKIKEALDRLEHLAKQKDFMGLQVLGVGGKQYPDQRLTTSYVIESDTFGRVEDKKKVIDLLLPSDVGGNEIGNEKCVIAIVGMGGLGKTTLAKLAYNDGRVQQHFGLKIWFCVSEEFVMPNVEKSIIEAATSLPCPEFKNRQELQVTVQKNLNGKKFLIVLDDVWSENPIHKEFLGQLLQYGTRGSKILVTTRNDSVALAMHAIATHHLDLLPKNDCWSLFEKHAFRRGSSNADPRIIEIGTQIVEKCKGLPLAIKAIGDLLGSKSDHAESYWTTILKSNLWDVPMEKTNIIPALWLSYKYLPSNLKRCFAYCSIFPKDYLFEKDKLVLLWMAEGFLQQSEIETMEEVGNGYFNDLVSRSLFQQSSRLFEPGFVMHDLVNDLAKSVTGKFGFTMEFDGSKEIGEMTRYLLCFNDVRSSSFEKIEKHLFKAKQLRTLLAINLSMGRLSSLNDYFKKNGEDLLVPTNSSISLRVLSLPDSNWDMSIKLFDFSKMKHLRYLDFSFTYINRLPDSICMLCNLQTLKLSYCENLDKWPRGMRKLINLRHLEFEQTPGLKEMPIQIGSLKCLQTLTKFVVSKRDSGSSIEELGKLINLRGKLLIQELQNVRSAKDALDAGLKDKGYLEGLVLRWNPSNESGISKSQKDVLENLQPHENLKGLTINYYGWNDFPDWIAQGLPSLSKISRIELSNCRYCTSLPPLGQLPSLIELRIEGFDGVVDVRQEFYGNSCSLMKPFGSLKFLSFKNMSNWKNWVHFSVQNAVETFSQLEVLYIQNCPKLSEGLPVHLPSLAKLEINECQDLEGSLMFLLKDDLLSTLKRLKMKDCKLELPMHGQHSSLEELFLTNCCDSLTSFRLDRFPNLKSIIIEGCTNLQFLEQHGGVHHLMISDIGIQRCHNLVSLPEGLRAPNLAKFTLDNCKSLSSMPNEMHLPSLHYLEIRSCPEVESFSTEGFPSNLKQIVISDCKKLIANWAGWDLQILRSLEWLEIGGKSENVVSFPGELLLPTTLTNLSIHSFENLKLLDREVFQNLTSLVQLKIRYCPKLKNIPGENFPESLRFLDIFECPVLVKELVKELESRDQRNEWPKVRAGVPNIIVQRRRIRGDDLWPAWISPYQ